MRMKKAIVAGVILIVVMTSLAQAQRRGGRRGGMDDVKRPEHITWNSDFTFCRLAYRQARDGDGGGWGVDYPRADMNLPIRLAELTQDARQFRRVERAESRRHSGDRARAVQMPVRDDHRSGRRLLRRGRSEGAARVPAKGRLPVGDDFWGSYAWSHWERELRKVLPASEYPIIDVPMNHSIFHTLFDAKRFPQIPSIGWVYSGTDVGARCRQRDGQRARRRRCEGRIIVFISHNTDFGDSYERESDDPTYFYNFSVEGYAIGINILLYAMTH